MATGNVFNVKLREAHDLVDSLRKRAASMERDGLQNSLGHLWEMEEIIDRIDELLSGIISDQIVPDPQCEPELDPIQDRSI